MENREHLHGSSVPSWTALLLPQEENGEAGAEHFSVVEELFNFSDGDDYAVLPVDDNGGSSKAAKEYQCSADSSSTVTTPHFCNNSRSNTPYSDELTWRCRLYSGLPGDLCEPEHLPEPDWMSYLGVEPYSDEELQRQQLISGITSTSSQPTHQQVDYMTFYAAAAAVDVEMLPFTPEVTVPDKAVISHKRNRGTAGIWSSHLDPTTESSSLAHSDAGIINPNPVKPPAKKKETSPDGVARRCQHCATEKTPQWRPGPMGPKSLCNACGVRYKSGRLLPEYRPASSPTFAVSEHSNSHRKVVEIRRQKGIPTPPYPPVNEGAVAAREGAAAAATEVATAGHNFLIYQHRYLPDFLLNF